MQNFEQHLNTLTSDPRIRQMKQYEQHTVSTTYDHVCHVARMSHTIVTKLHINCEEEELIKGALLHDYYLYDFRQHPDMGAYEHGTSHAENALKNAELDFELTDRERNIIYSHMWPLNLTHLPKCKEAWIVTLADKICAFNEMVLHRQHIEDKVSGATA